MLHGPRFYGDDFLAACLDGQTFSKFSAGNPPESVKSIQQALNDAKEVINLDLGIQPALSVDGVFGSNTETFVKAYQNARGLAVDGVIGPATMTALDDDFALELFQAKAAHPPTGFPLGERTGDRVDASDGFATCRFTNGVCMELGHAVVFFVPTDVMKAWTDAGGIDGKFGLPTDDPRTDNSPTASMSFQEFSQVTYVFGLNDKPSSFALPAAVWHSSVVARERIGRPTGPLEPIGSNPSVRKAPHQKGVVLAVEDSIPVALEDAIVKVWQDSEQSGKSLGKPVGSAYLAADDTSIHYPFENGTIVPGPAGPTV